MFARDGIVAFTCAKLNMSESEAGALVAQHIRFIEHFCSCQCLWSFCSRSGVRYRMWSYGLVQHSNCKCIPMAGELLFVDACQVYADIWLFFVIYICTANWHAMLLLEQHVVFVQWTVNAVNTRNHMAINKASRICAEPRLSAVSRNRIRQRLADEIPDIVAWIESRERDRRPNEPREPDGWA